MTPNTEVIRIMCPNLACQRILAVPSHARGKLVRCRSCGMNVRIPQTKTAKTETPAGEAASDSKAAGKPTTKPGQAA